MGNFNPAFHANYKYLTPEQKQFAIQQYLASQQQLQEDPSLQLQQQQQQPPQQPPAGGVASIAGQVGGKYLANSLMDGGGEAAASASETPMTLEGMQSLSNGGNGLMSMGGADSGVGAVSGTPGAATMTVNGPMSLAGFGTAGNVYLPAIGALGAYNLIQHQGDAPRGDYARGIGQGALSGAAIGSYFGPWGALIGGGVGGLAGGIGALTGSGKDKAQMNRDRLRKALQATGIADDKYMINGVDIGADGGSMDLKNLGTNIDGKNQRHSYDVDFSNPLSGGTVSAVNPLTMALLGNGAKQKQIDDLNGMLTNSVMNGATDQATINKNIQALYAKIPGLNTPGLPTGPVPSLNAPGVTLGVLGGASLPARSQTLSPGISKTGQRISYQGHK